MTNMIEQREEPVIGQVRVRVRVSVRGKGKGKGKS